MTTISTAANLPLQPMEQSLQDASGQLAGLSQDAPVGEMTATTTQDTIDEPGMSLSQLMARNGMSYPQDYALFLQMNPDFEAGRPGGDPNIVYLGETFNFPAPPQDPGANGDGGATGDPGVTEDPGTGGDPSVTEDPGAGGDPAADAGNDPVGNQGEPGRYDPQALDQAIDAYEETVGGDPAVDGTGGPLDPDSAQARTALNELSDVVRTQARALIDAQVQPGDPSLTPEQALAIASGSIDGLLNHPNPEVRAMAQAELAEFARDDAFVRLQTAQAAYDEAVNSTPPASQAEIDARYENLQTAQGNFDDAVQAELEATQAVADAAGQNPDSQAQAVREQTERMADELEQSGADPALVEQVREEGEAKAREIESGQVDTGDGTVNIPYQTGPRDPNAPIPV